MKIENLIFSAVTGALNKLYQFEPPAGSIQLQITRKEFVGDITLVVFPFLKISRKGPEATATEIGEYLLSEVPDVKSFNVVKGFLNIEISDSYWITQLQEAWDDQNYGRKKV